jgi:hypothetical protein
LRLSNRTIYFVACNAQTVSDSIAKYVLRKCNGRLSKAMHLVVANGDVFFYWCACSVKLANGASAVDKNIRTVGSCLSQITSIADNIVVDQMLLIEEPVPSKPAKLMTPGPIEFVN